MYNENVGNPRADPYTQLDALHKLVEELRATIAELRGKLTDLENAIGEHHNSIFKEVKPSA